MGRRAALSGDGRLRYDQRLAYLILNAIDNRSPYRDVGPDLWIADFQCADALDRLSELPGTPSPSRAMSDLFWMHLPWDAMVGELGPLRVLDLGCGSGHYAERLAQWSGQRIARYTGLDLQPHGDWGRRAAAFPFIELQVGDIADLDRLILSDTNLIVSQSTIEHVADDDRAFRQIHEYAHRVGRPLVQIHLVPSAACLRLYLWHGYRQYTPRTLTMLTAPYADGSDRLLIRLGGRACNALHQRFITWPVLIRRAADRRDTRSEEYRRALAAAIADDMRRPQRSPAFYALMLHSNRQGPPLRSHWWHRASEQGAR